MIHLDVIVADTATLLEAEAYGPGALLRWERAPEPDGTFVEGGTVALVADQSVYDIWDAAGTVGTWYRTRISNAAASTFSGYSVPYQTTEQGLYLTLGQCRGFGVGSDLEDESLLILLGAAAQDIVEFAGPMGAPIREWHRPNGALVYLSKPALAITSISEDSVVLADDDWELDGGGQLLRRLNDGTNPSWYWRPFGPLIVTYQPKDELAQRQRVQLELVKQDINHQAGGLASQTIGQWSESYQASAPDSNYATERAAILASLNPGAVLIR